MGGHIGRPTEDKQYGRFSGESQFYDRQTLRGSGEIHKRGGNLGVHPSCAPARRQRTFPRSAERNSPLNPSEKLSARQGRTRLRQFACPGQPVQKRSRPERANPPAAVRVPRSAGAEKSCRPERANRLRGSSAPEGRCRKQKNSTLFRVLLRITHAYAFLINASRRSRPLSISVSEVA